MTLEQFRDIVIIVMGIVATGALIFLSILVYSLYRRMNEIMKPLEAASTALQTLAMAVTRPLSEPINQVAAFVEGVRDGLQKVVAIFQKGG